MSEGREGRLASYFGNHRLGRVFPWSLYHRPIDHALRDFLGGLSTSARVLNVGCGTFLNLPELPTHVTYTGTDLDPRAVEACRARYPGVRFETCAPLRLPFDDASFDAAYATEVIEHADRPEEWLREVMRVVRPEGRVFLTTPNYASVSLNVIESTVLEAVARLQGFTRRGIHPQPCTAPILEALVRAVGGVEPRARTIAFDWVIAIEFGVA
jgi:SAM-dependent methyltransferase